MALLAIAVTPLVLPAAEKREGLLLEYTFEGTVKDTSGNNHDGTVHGDPTFAPGKVGQCLSFDGNGDFIDAGTAFPELRDTFTFECWVRPAATQNRYADIMGNHAGGGITGYVVQQNDTAANEFGFGYGNGSTYVDLPRVQLAADRWQHLAVVKTPERLFLYINGLRVGTAVARGPVAVSTVNFRVGLGFADPARCFRGSIDEVRVWSTPRASFNLDVPAPEKIETFLRYVRVAAKPSASGGFFAPDANPLVVFRVDRASVPAGVHRIEVTCVARTHAVDAPVSVPPAVLVRHAGFETAAALPQRPGHYRVTYQPAIRFQGRRRLMPGGSFAVSVPPRPEPAESIEIPVPGVTPLPPPLSLSGDAWLLAKDPHNEGKNAAWWKQPHPGASTARVPGVIQEPFPSFHGVAWYWRTFTAPEHSLPGGRYLLRFGAVDYLAEVWVNGVFAGGHEGGETPFLLDITGAIKPAHQNLLAVRVLNPTNERIDGFVLAEIPHRNKAVPYANGRSFNTGGITEPVALLLVPAVYLTDLYARPDPETGTVLVHIELVNALDRAVPGSLELSLSTAAAGEFVCAARGRRSLEPGHTLLAIELTVPAPRRWQLHDPFLYRATARIETAPGAGIHEHAVRFGFRDFRVTDGFFRLNGKRIFVRSTHTGNHCPVGQVLPPPQAPDLLRRDLLYAKASGFNMVRFIAGMAHPWQLDICDEIGLMVYEESYAGWLLGDSPKMAERFDSSTAGMVRRDRNHPSVVIWGLLNESDDNPVFKHAVESLNLVRFFDDTRLVLLNSGRWDGRFHIGSVANPQSRAWHLVWGAEDPDYTSPVQWGSGGYVRGAGDAHVYTGAPLTAAEKNLIRTLGHGMKPVFLSEGGIGSVMHVIRELRCYEQAGADLNAEDAVLMRSMAASFTADWKRLGMDTVYAFPEDMLSESQRLHGRQRLLVFDLVRSNPRICGYSLTGMLDHGMTGEGLWRFWREWKPGIYDVLQDGWAPVRWCCFVEPMHGYAGRPFRIEAVLANEDVLAPGKYPVWARVRGPTGVVWERRTDAVIPQPPNGRDGPLAVPVLLDDVTIHGAPGRYELVVTMKQGGAPAGGRLTFHITDPAQLPRIERDVRLIGIDVTIRRWLQAHGLRCPEPPAVPRQREIILIGDTPSHAAFWTDLAQRVARGSYALFLSPEGLRRGGNAVGGLLLKEKGRFYHFHDWLYHKECVARAHPVFDGLPAPGILDWDYYGPLITRGLFDGQPTPDDVIVAAFALGYPCPGGYTAGTMMGAYRFGEGVFLVNTLAILRNVDTHPAADRLLLNLIRHAAGSIERPLAPLPADFKAQLKEIGY